MIIKSFKIFESIQNYSIYVIEINNFKDAQVAMSYLRTINDNIYNEYLLHMEGVDFPNWLFIYKISPENYDRTLIFSYKSEKSVLFDKINEPDSKIYPRIFTMDKLDNLYYILKYGKMSAKSMYAPPKKITKN